uniref:Retrotransposon protein, putative, Ty3-gypsy subclass n=1 Tax=Oryza sativa subsp. japonica TaxID=39947 RepID=Q2QQT6_ORYSJ|nr:retrotransposon protein, putative, Ty3-gypsy subclass [Oryza sativa Japonica Group]
MVAADDYRRGGAAAEKGEGRGKGGDGPRLTPGRRRRRRRRPERREAVARLGSTGSAALRRSATETERWTRSARMRRSRRRRRRGGRRSGAMTAADRSSAATAERESDVASSNPARRKGGERQKRTEEAFRFSSLDFITNDFGKISLLDSDLNQSGRGQVFAPFGIPNSTEIYSRIISTESAPNHSDEIQSTPTRPDQDDGAYPSILMKLPDDLAAVFTARASSPRRSRRDPASAPIQSSSREVGVILQPLGTVSTEQLDGYLSSPGIDSRPMEIVEYDDFGYRYDYRNLDDFDEGYEDN